MDALDSNIKKLYGVGEVRAFKYNSLGIYRIRDLLAHYPRGYEDRGNVILLDNSDGMSKCSYILTVATAAKSVRIKGRMTLTKFRAYDNSASCEITFFNQDYLKNVFIPGRTFRFYGKLERKMGRYVMSSPAFEECEEGSELPSLVPVYPLTEGLSQKQLAKDMNAALILLASSNEADTLPEEIRRKHSLCTYSYAVRNIHKPDSFSALAAAKKRLIFDEFFEFALGVSMAGANRKRESAYSCTVTDTAPIFNALPFAPTGAQKRVIDEIAADMKRDTAMSRIVIGDVGSGKTLCAAAAMLFAVQNGKQAALMAPTEILARQHYASLCEMLGGLGLNIELLVGAATAKEKRRIYSGLADSGSNKIDIAVGTHALISEGVEFSSLGLVIVDEQHRFGAGQRAALAKKSEGCHTLVMSATPIPRSFALALYGDLDISYIDEMPAGRQVVDTFVVDESYRQRLNAFIEKQVGEGGQVYVVCPAIEESDDGIGKDDDVTPDFLLSDIDIFGELVSKAESAPPLKSAVEFSKELSEALPNLNIDFLHGKMTSKQKEERMRAFADGDTDVLVSTTVIEVGVNVVRASLMIVENAERFGLSQLHQLRGRVGRGERKSYCVLVSESAKKQGSTAKKRLDILKNSHDGYKIAEQDLAMRGPGDFLRTADNRIRQSGGLRFKLAELCEDEGLMRTAFDEAKSLLAEDITLEKYPILKEKVKYIFEQETGYIN